MSNGRPCCILGVCCPPAKQAESLAHVIEDAGSPAEAAAAILAVADLVPKGVGETITRAYRAMLREPDQG